MNSKAKSVVITGANRGIGLAMAKLFKQQGNVVYALCRQSSNLLDTLGVNVIENIDVSTDKGLINMTSALKNISINVLVCNAGILRDESLSDINVDTIREQFEVNALAPLRIVDALQANLVQEGKVAMITSRMGSISDNGSGGRYGYFPLLSLKNTTCRFFYIHYNIYKTTWVECYGVAKRILNYKK